MTLTESQESGRSASPGGWLADAKRVDEAVYRAIAVTPTPGLDRAMSTLSRSANYSRLWVGSAAVLAMVGGRAVGVPRSRVWCRLQ